MPLQNCYSSCRLQNGNRCEASRSPIGITGQVFAEDRKLSGVSALPADTAWPGTTAFRQVVLALPRFLLGAVPFHWAAPSPAVCPLSSPFVPPNKPQEARPISATPPGDQTWYEFSTRKGRMARYRTATVRS